MSGIITRNRHIIILALIMLMSGSLLSGQTSKGFRSLKLTLGGGYGHYFNTFTNVLDEDIKNNRPSFAVKLMWQPEHLIGIGFESGYYEFYSTTRIETGGTIRKLTTNLDVIPLFLTFSVKATRHISINFATGGALMGYTIYVNKSKKGDVTGKALSLSNFAAGISWSVPAGKRIEFGTEFRYLYIGKTADNHVSAFATISYNIINKRVTKPD
jgi:hypothetical protein